VSSKGLLGGLALSDLTPETRKKFDIPDKIDSGAVVTDLDPRSAVARAGVAPGDVIIQVDQNPVTEVKDFRRLADKVEDAKSALLLVARESGTMFVLVKK
jgi:serine protease Do